MILFIGSQIWWKEEGCYASKDNGQEVRYILDDDYRNIMTYPISILIDCIH